jgi:antitoxin VapB
MPRHAKIFRNGGSQAVRLPRSCRFEGQSEVVARREGRRVVLEPLDEWPDTFLRSLGALSESLERPARQPLAKARVPLR